MNKIASSIAVVALFCSSQAVLAQAAPWPAQPVRLIVGFEPGGPADLAARVLAKGLQGEWKQPVTVENRSGAGGDIATDYVAKQPPDGHTILITSASYTVNPAMAANSTYDPMKDFIPVGTIGTQANAVAVSSSLPVDSIADLRKLAEARGKALSFATGGLGTSSDLSAKFLFNMLWGSSMQAIPYKGAGPAGMAVATGEPPVGFTTVTGLLPLKQQGRVKILAVVDNQRMPQLPDVPTMAELGFPDLHPSWTGAMLRAGTPKPVVDTVHESINKLLASPEFQAEIKGQMMAAAEPRSIDELYGYLQSELTGWARIVKMAGLGKE